MAAKVCIHMEGKKTTIASPGVSGFFTQFAQFNLRRWAFGRFAAIL